MTIVDEETTVAPSTAAPHPKRLRAVLGWLLIAGLLIGFAMIASLFSVKAPGEYRSLDPEGPNSVGALALAEILRDQGVDVEVFRSWEQARAAIDDDTTLVMTNPYTLSDESLAMLLEPAERVVFLSTGAHLLDELDLGDYAYGNPGSVEAECDIEQFSEVGQIVPDQLFAPRDGVVCFGDDEGAAVLIDETADTQVALVDGSRLFSNGYLAEDGNAALALALLGQTDHVVWYVPNVADTDIQGATPDTLGMLTPEWVTPAIILLMLAGVAAAIWRGRRFGPLVAETLPVSVRASETMHGRARLTAKAADAPHAAAALRDGSQRRLARRLGLSVRSTSDEVADAASDRLRIPRGTLQALLAGPLPTDEADLIDLARRLAELETAVDTSLRPRESDTTSEHDPSITTEAEASRDH